MSPLEVMTNQAIQDYIDAAIRENFSGYTQQSGELTTSPEGDGRFLGKVYATLYMGLPGGQDLYLALGGTEAKRQIIKFGDSECLSPTEKELDLILYKELNIKLKEDDEEAPSQDS